MCIFKNKTKVGKVEGTRNSYFKHKIVKNMPKNSKLLSNLNFLTNFTLKTIFLRSIFSTKRTLARPRHASITKCISIEIELTASNCTPEIAPKFAKS